MAMPTTKERTVDAAAFAAARPETPANLVPVNPAPNIAVHDGVISAQKVAVERDEARVLQRLKTLAAAAGESWYYRFPVRSKDGRQWIEGPSIKLANDVARCYGNCQVDVRALDQGQAWIFYARFVDIETGYSLTRAFQQQKDAARLGGDDIGRKLDIAFQIGQSKAIRNVIVNALQTFADFAFEEARANLVEKVGKNLDRYRDRVVARLAELRVDPARVERVVGRAAKDWLAPDVARIVAELQAIGDGMAAVDDVWPRLDEGQAATARPTRADFADKSETDKAAEEAQPEPPDMDRAYRRAMGETVDDDTGEIAETAEDADGTTAAHLAEGHAVGAPAPPLLPSRALADGSIDWPGWLAEAKAVLANAPGPSWITEWLQAHTATLGSLHGKSPKTHAAFMQFARDARVALGAPSG